MHPRLSPSSLHGALVASIALFVGLFVPASAARAGENTLFSAPGDQERPGLALLASGAFAATAQTLSGSFTPLPTSVFGFDPSGARQWEHHFDGRWHVLASNDETYWVVRDNGVLAGALDVAKLDAAGAILWQESVDFGFLNYEPIETLVLGDELVFSAWTYAGPAALVTHIGRLDAAGAVAWETRIAGQAEVHALADGGLLAFGRSIGEVDVQGGSDDAVVYRFASDGNLDWEHALGGVEDDEATHFVETDDGGILLVGTGGPLIWHTKIDAAGAIAHQAAIELGQTTAVSGIATGPDGFYAWGMGFEQQVPAHTLAVLLRFDRDGAFVWTRSVELQAPFVPFFAAAPTGGGCVLVGLQPDSATLSKSTLVLSFAPDGDLEWRRRLTHANYTVPFHAHATSDGGVVVAGTGGGDGWATELSPAGVSSWKRVFDKGVCGLVEALVSPDGRQTLAFLGKSAHVVPPQQLVYESDLVLLDLKPSGAVRFARRYPRVLNAYSDGIGSADYVELERNSAADLRIVAIADPDADVDHEAGDVWTTSIAANGADAGGCMSKGAVSKPDKLANVKLAKVPLSTPSDASADFALTGAPQAVAPAASAVSSPTFDVVFTPTSGDFCGS